MREFIAGLLGDVNLDTPNLHFRNSLDLIQGPTDTVLQYLEHFFNIQKAVTTGRGTPDEANVIRGVDRGRF